MNFRNISDIKGTTPHSPHPLNLARVRIPPLTGITVASKINQLPATCPLPNGNPKKLSLIKDCGRNGVLKGVWKCWSKQVGHSKSLSEVVNRHGRSVLSLVLIKPGQRSARLKQSRYNIDNYYGL